MLQYSCLKDVSADEVIKKCRERSADIFGTPCHKDDPAEQNSKEAKTGNFDGERNAKSSMFRLPTFVHVHEIASLKQCEKLLASALAAVAQEEKEVMVVGLDTEWGEGSRVTLLQIAFEKYCFLVRVVAYAGTHSRVPFSSR